MIERAAQAAYEEFLRNLPYEIRYGPTVSEWDQRNDEFKEVWCRVALAVLKVCGAKIE